ncbi:hypothetical protein CapIbe_007508 [Capra ibex]
MLDFLLETFSLRNSPKGSSLNVVRPVTVYSWLHWMWISDPRWILYCLSFPGSPELRGPAQSHLPSGLMKKKGKEI